MLKIYNTLTKDKSVFTPVEEGIARMYVCGPTVYDSPHIGHVRSAYVFEIVRRYFEHKGLKVIFVRNVTDVDDKIINKASAELGVEGKPAEGDALKEKCREVAARYLDEYHEAMDSMDIKRPDFEPKATQSIDDMIRFIEALVDKDHAYEAGGNVYFSVESFDGYGKLSGQDIDNMKAGARVDPDTNKRYPLDFALWKQVKPGEPSWPSPWGPGRPGWHIECSVMSTGILGDEFDIHGGGLDLIFPHHENEKAQAEAKTGKPFARVWMHNGFLTVNGEKMSKSLGNFVTVADHMGKYPDPDLLKMLFLSSHYRSPVDYAEDKIAEAASAKSRIMRFIENVGSADEKAVPAGQVNEDDSFERAMDDDFNTPVALSAIFEAVQEGNSLLSEGNIEKAREKRDYIMECAGILGLSFEPKIIDNDEVEKIEQLIEERRNARASKDFKRADEIRDELVQMGVELEDSPEGTKWRKN